MTTPGHLVGAYGMFWDRYAVDWFPGSGPAKWQLLGRVNSNRPTLRVCDFRLARGFYVLFDDFRANYVGLARGGHGIGSRLRSHHKNRTKENGRDWNRFCWFSFDDVFDANAQGWSVVERRDALRSISSELVIRECEALLITVLGSRDQNQMRFQSAQRWEQLDERDFVQGGIGLRVESWAFTDGRLKQLALAAET